MGNRRLKQDTGQDGRLCISNSFAYYLPQFHQIPENDIWWEPGHTEWSSLRRAQSWHPDQIILKPGELGCYDLSNPEVMGQQYDLAQRHSVDTFAIWHYWFGNGELLLEKPAEDLLKGREHVRFCFAWANHDWMKRSTGETLKRQTYDADADRHFAYLEPFFHDSRYRRIDGKPVFMMFSAGRHPNLGSYIESLQKSAQKSGFAGIHFIFDNCDQNDRETAFCDNFCNSTRALKFQPRLRRATTKLSRKLNLGTSRPTFANYKDCVEKLNLHINPNSSELPVVFPGWDTTIRHGVRGTGLLGATPLSFARQLDRVRDILATRPNDKRIAIIKSWNEWAEGNVIEPSTEYGRAFLETFANRFKTEGVASC